MRPPGPRPPHVWYVWHDRHNSRPTVSGTWGPSYCASSVLLARPWVARGRPDDVRPPEHGPRYGTVRTLIPESVPRVRDVEKR